MNDPYAPPMASLGAFYPVGYPAMMLPEHHHLQGYHQPPILTMENLGGFPGYEDIMPPITAHSEPTRRRRSVPGADHVKHRRTRSGCYTCRQRRVKCDETHPVCERCRKGKRECTYPGNTSASSSKAAKDAAKDKASPGTASATDSDAEGEEVLPTSTLSDVEEDEDLEDEPLSAVSPSIQFSDTQSTTGIQASPSSSTAQSSMSTNADDARDKRKNVKQTQSTTEALSGRWAALPEQIKFYLNYHRDHLSYHHYGMKYDGSNFLKSVLLDIAVGDANAALLYSIVSFAAYHHSHSSNEGKIQTFLTYYNQAIKFLQQSLKSRRHTVSTLLAILQLATIEEFLGDWVNLIGHNRAAHRILTDLFTPQTITQDETRRKILAWYNRFALFANMMSGGQTKLSREWVAAAADYYQAQAQARPDDVSARFEDLFSRSRLLATEAALLLASKLKDQISTEELFGRAMVFRESFEAFGDELEKTYTDPSCFAQTFPAAPASSENDIADYRDPHFLRAGDYAPMNSLLMDYWGMDLTFKYQVSMALRQPPPEELTELALKKAKMFDAIRFGDQRSVYTLLSCQASLAMLALFLPKDEKHNMWARRSFALIEERYGYIFPATIRHKMGALWHEDVSHWWLPNDEGYPPSLRAIREFIDYRATQPIDKQGQDVRDMSGIFQQNMSLND